jgi:PAS domain S-box-containing protein
MNWRLVTFLLAALVAVLTGMVWHVSRLQWDVVTSTALRAAQIYSIALVEFRTAYTSEVVEPAIASGIDVAHDYIDRPRTIPLPATLSMILGERIGKQTGGAAAQLYSPYPFPWQQNIMTDQDTFKQAAWNALSEDPETPYFEFEETDGNTILRYATSDIMRPSCVTCHNTHPDTPRNDWKEGDLRGVLEVNLPLDSITVVVEDDLRSMIVIYSVVGLLAVISIGFTVGTLRQQAATLRKRVGEQTSELKTQVEGRLQSERDTIRSETWNRTIVETTISAIITIDTQGKVASINSATELLFGYERSEILGNNVSMLMPDPYQTEHDGYLERYHTTREPHIIGTGREVEAQRKDGSVFPAYLSVGEAIIEDETMYVGVIHDITKQKEAERLKDDFISTVSHELRTPLTSIKGALTFISEGVAGELPQKAKDLADIARRNSDRLILLINDILDIEKIQAGKLTIDMRIVKIPDLVSTAVDSNKGYGEKDKISISMSPEDVAKVEVRGDENRLLQVMANLLSNAVKYSDPGGDVGVAARYRPGTGNVRISVTDHGSGIPDAFRSQIFEKFSQADDAETAQRKGTGLGLAISKKIVELHGGTIGFDTKEGEGSVFFFDMPVEPASD